MCLLPRLRYVASWRDLTKQIRKSLAVKLILNTRTFADVIAVFEEYLQKFKAESVNTPQMKSVLSAIEKKIQSVKK